MMIEINLIEKKQRIKIPVIFGIDVRDINLPWLGIALVLYYLPGALIYPMWKEGVQEIEKNIKNEKKELRKIRGFLSKNKAMNEKLKAYRGQFERLKQRTEQVEKIIKMRVSPKNMLEHVARNIPEDMWINELKVRGEDESISFKGESISYKSIGDFITHGNDSPYFGRSLNLGDSKTVEKLIDGKKLRVQEYEIKGSYKGTN